MIAVGSIVGSYRVLQKIGQGAMGSVWLAQHPSIGKRVAMKVIHPELAANEEMLSRFFNEARVVTKIGHEHIVEVQDFGQTPEGDSFIVMELLEGEGLGARIKGEGAFSVARTIHVAHQLAEGLQAAHDVGVIHRDLKPDNIFLIPRGNDPDFVKILDFGLAKLTAPGAMAHMTRTGALLGTPHYMAPESAESSKKVDHRVDVYALGCIVFEMLTGRVPFTGEGFGEVLVKHLREPPPLLSRINPTVPPALEQIVLHALAKKPDQRFPSMAQFAAALRDPGWFMMTIAGGGFEPEVARASSPAPQAPPPQAPPRAAAARLGAHEPTLLREIPEMNPGAWSGPAPGGTAVVAYDPAAMSHPASVQAEPNDRYPAPARKRMGGTVLLGLVGGLLALAAVGGIGLYGYRQRVADVTVRFQTTPSGAEVRRGETPVGVAPVVLRLPRSEEAMLFSFRLKGYLAAQRSVRPTADQVISVRLLVEPPPVPPPDPEPPPIAQTQANPGGPAPDSAARPAVAGKDPAAADPDPPAPKHSRRKVVRARPKTFERDGLLLTPSF